MTTPFRQWVPEEAMAACSDRAPAWISGSEETKMDSANVANHVISGTTPLPSKGGSGSLNSSTGSTLAGNFQSFLTLLTTQLKNQNPLDPLDTNQFTQQLVQFAGVEQQINMNHQLTSLVALQKPNQVTSAMSFHAPTATVDGSPTKHPSGTGSWSLS